MQGPVKDGEAGLPFPLGCNFINLKLVREAKILEDRKSRLMAESTSTGRVAAVRNWLWIVEDSDNIGYEDL